MLPTETTDNVTVRALRLLVVRSLSTVTREPAQDDRRPNVLFPPSFFLRAENVLEAGGSGPFAAYLDSHRILNQILVSRWSGGRAKTMSKSPVAHVRFSMAIWESDVASYAKGNPWSRSFTLIPAPSSSRAAESRLRFARLLLGVTSTSWVASIGAPRAMAANAPMTTYSTPCWLSADEDVLRRKLGSAHRFRALAANCATLLRCRASATFCSLFERRA